MVTEKFSMEILQWDYVLSREIGGSAPPTRVGIIAANITCLNCQHTWKASKTGDGRLAAAIGGEVFFRCPGCGTSHSFNLRNVP